MTEFGETAGNHICIVGAGPAGVLLTLILARNGIPVTLVESQPDFRILMDTTFTGLRKENGQVVGINCVRAGGPGSIPARLVVAADGRNSAVEPPRESRRAVSLSHAALHDP